MDGVIEWTKPITRKPQTVVRNRHYPLSDNVYPELWLFRDIQYGRYFVSVYFCVWCNWNHAGCGILRLLKIRCKSAFLMVPIFLYPSRVFTEKLRYRFMAVVCEMTLPVTVTLLWTTVRINSDNLNTFNTNPIFTRRINLFFRCCSAHQTDNYLSKLFASHYSLQTSKTPTVV
jgi:hypothetical protein